MWTQTSVDLIHAWGGAGMQRGEYVGRCSSLVRGPSLAKVLARDVKPSLPKRRKRVERTVGSLMVLGYTRLPRLPVVAELPLQMLAARLFVEVVQGLADSTAKNRA